PPYTGETALSVAYRHVNEDMPAPSTAGAAVPAPLDDLVVRATRRDPAARPPDASAFLRTLQMVRTDLGINPVPVPVTVAALPPDQGPRGTRALVRVDVTTDGPEMRRGGPTEPPSGPQLWKPLPHDDPYLRERARNRRAFIVWMVVVLMLAIAVGVGAWWLGSGRWTVVPNLTGVQRGAVQATLAAAGLQPNLTEDHNDVVPGGTVISSDPGPGGRAVRGSGVTVVISLGHPVVPNLAVGTTLGEAEDALREADLSPQRNPAAEEFHNTAPKGTVTELQPAPGTTLTVGAPVTLVISKGPVPTIVVPKVIGLSVAQARQVLADAGLSSTVSQSFSGFPFLGGLPDQVISQSPGAGRPVRPGSTVALRTL
ncbi:MAG TPA: PASTA domain-containing protein, partial [Pseudonocardiaceae bacterium]|nr:PASTA domain-containing protein [Pseudonocardiaceae bacterium]